MSRNLRAEKKFLVLGTYIPDAIRRAYTLMNADFNPDKINYSLYGTVIEMYENDELCKSHAIEFTMREIRYFALVLSSDDTVFSIKTIVNYIEDEPPPSGYIGIPIQQEYPVITHGFNTITYPHITLVSPTDNLVIHSLIIGKEFPYEISELIPTPNTLAHHVKMPEATHHVTRAIRFGKTPVITAREITPGKLYESKGELL